MDWLALILPLRIRNWLGPGWANPTISNQIKPAGVGIQANPTKSDQIKPAGWERRLKA